MLTQMGGCRIAAKAYGVSEPKPDGAPERSDGGLRVRGHAGACPCRPIKSLSGHSLDRWRLAERAPVVSSMTSDSRNSEYQIRLSHGRGQ